MGREGNFVDASYSLTVAYSTQFRVQGLLLDMPVAGDDFLIKNQWRATGSISLSASRKDALNYLTSL
jgi:hypothetical protein